MSSKSSPANQLFLEDKMLKCPRCGARMLLKPRGLLRLGKPQYVCPKCNNTVTLE